MAKTAIVIGATGLVGRHLIQQLLLNPAFTRIVSLSRNPLGFTDTKLESHIIDFNQLPQYADLFQGDCLFSCLGSTLKQSQTRQAQYKVDVEHQFMAAQLAAQNHVPFYLLVSSSGANEHSQSAYLKMKGQLEKQICQLNFQHIAIFQPSLIIGERPHSRFAENLAKHLLPLLCKLPRLCKFRPIKGQQVALKMLQVSLQQTTFFQRITLDQVFPD